MSLKDDLREEKYKEFELPCKMEDCKTCNDLATCTKRKLHTQIPNRVLFNSQNLTNTEFRLYIIIAGFIRSKKKQNWYNHAWLTYTELSKISGISYTTIGRNVKSLVNKGYIVHKQWNTSYTKVVNVFQLVSRNIDEELDDKQGKLMAKRLIRKRKKA